MAGTVNSQITDAVTQANALTIGLAPGASVAMACITMAESIGLAMQNAVTAQQNMQQIEEAVVVATSAQILKAGASA